MNRDLRLDRIKWVGCILCNVDDAFAHSTVDMDYTLAQYNSPEYEELSYDLIIERLVQMGYPESIKKLKYDAAFPIR